MINYIYQLVSPKVFSEVYVDISINSKVIIRPEYLAVCHADQRYYLGQRDSKTLKMKLPMALIHECCGIVVSDSTKTYKVGQRVVLIPNTPTEKDGIIYENYAKSSYFLSSGYDGFMREFVDMNPDRVVAYDNIKPQVAAITEFVSVGVHSSSRFDLIAHPKRETIGLWGDGSLAYTMACILTKRFPDVEIIVIGKDERKLSHFSFVSKTYIADEIDDDFSVDHAFECAGGEGSFYAIDDIIKYINP
ncbi:MAG: alcohol dehydrogenase catalytic domain-containing protein, partial [Clostridia bacterium]